MDAQRPTYKHTDTYHTQTQTQSIDWLYMYPFYPTHMSLAGVHLPVCLPACLSDYQSVRASLPGCRLVLFVCLCVLTDYDS
mmetsp:Transcript_8145/g.23133  ORF Transcript_8145/g.23133 Transcript_8145/m.23133 type:complete len:81 (+) Transcript_8145:130-372(+)